MIATQKYQDNHREHGHPVASTATEVIITMYVRVDFGIHLLFWCVYI